MSRAAHSWALGRQGRGYRLKIVWGQSGSLRDSGEHDRANFLIIVEREDEVGPPFARERAVGAGLFALVSTRFATAPRGLAAPWPLASCSRRLEGHIQELAGRLLMFEPLCQYAQRQCLDFGHRLGLVGTITEHTRKIRDLRDPAAVRLAFELDLEDHKGTLAPEWLPNKPLQPTSGRCIRLLPETEPAARG
jgi:hypothetical protein